MVELAATRGLTGIALTDHDNTGGVERARAAANGTGLTVLLGCELSAEHDASPVHVLAYGFDPGEPAFAAKRAWILEGRVGRTRRMVERLRELGAPVDFDRVGELAGGGALGRPHVARAMVEAGVVDELGDAFSQDWIGTGGRAYVAKDAVTPTEAVELIHGAGGWRCWPTPRSTPAPRPFPSRSSGPWPPPASTALRSTTPTSRRATGPAGGPWPPSWAWRRPGPRTATAPSTATVWAASGPPTRPSTACSPAR